MTQDIARAGVAAYKDLKRVQPEKLYKHRDDHVVLNSEVLDALLAAVALLEPVASGEAVIVPVEPTEEMLKASHTALYHWRENVAKDPQQDPTWKEKHAIRYRAMIAGGKL